MSRSEEANEISRDRAAAAAAIGRALAAARRVTLTTHMNADGDGAGCEAALAHALGSRGTDVAIVNPTPFPPSYAFLLPTDARVHLPGPAAAQALAAAELHIVLDTSEPARLGELEAQIDESRGIIVDHHGVSQRRIGGRLQLIDPVACATAELVHDVLLAGGFELTPEVATALYVAVVTDTGSFRYSNATPRAHRLAAQFVALGVNPQAVYRRIYASLSPRHLQILRAALEGLEPDPEFPVTWVRLPADRAASLGELDDWEPIMEPARNLEGTEVAVLLRELGDGRVKVSIRSNGDVNVAALAHALGGGGHEKASGAVTSGTLDEVAGRLRALFAQVFPRS